MMGTNTDCMKVIDTMGTVTIKDIAQAAGVSHPTVSKALNNAPGVNPQTRERILELAEQMHYVPNIAAKRLANKANRSIGFIWPPTKGLFFYHLCNALQKEAKERGINVIISMSDPVQALHTFNEHFIDFVACWFPPDWIPTMEFMNERSLFQGSVVVLGGGRTEATHCFLIDRFHAVYRAVSYLAEMGHRNIAYLGGGERTEKLNGYIQAILDCKLNYSSNFIVAGADYYNDQLGQAAADSSQTLEQFSALWNSDNRPTALIAESQQASFELLRLANVFRLHVPEDLSVICYDDIPELNTFNSAITTCGPSCERLAREILDLYENPPEQGQYLTKTIAPELQQRQSVLPCGSKS